MAPVEQLEPTQTSSFWQTLSKQQKWSLAGLLLFTLLVLVLWVAQLRQNLLGGYGGYNLKEIQNANSNQQANQALLQVNQTRDTDGDGLLDYQEMSIYGTSPYLADSDSDGIGDKEEIEGKTNPNCPEGQVCQGDNLVINPSANGQNTTINNPLDQLNPQELKPEALSATQLQTLQAAFGASPTAEQLRQALLQAGADPAEVQKISDADLLNNYQQMVKGQ